MQDQKQGIDFNDIDPYTGEELSNSPYAVVEIESQRSIAEVQAAMAIAQRFPRNTQSAYVRIMDACKRLKLAEQAAYAYPRGGTTVTGPSIRLAEVIAQNWGNLKYGLRELTQKIGESEVEAYAWDLETNVYVSRTFVQKHLRKARGEINTLEDPRDIYEMIANQGQRRVRACILEIIPGDIVEDALNQCERTLKGQSTESIEVRARKVALALSDYGVTTEMIEERLGHKLTAIIEQELVNLRKIYNSLKDNTAKREDFFKVGNLRPQTSTSPKNSSQFDSNKDSSKDPDDEYIDTFKNLKTPKGVLDFESNQRNILPKKSQKVKDRWNDKFKQQMDGKDYWEWRKGIIIDPGPESDEAESSESEAGDRITEEQFLKKMADFEVAFEGSGKKETFDKILSDHDVKSGQSIPSKLYKGILSDLEKEWVKIMGK